MANKRSEHSSLRFYAVAACSGAAVALLNYLVGLFMIAHGLHAEATFLDEFLLMIFTSALVLLIELSHERTKALMSEKLKTIELMNHHIRNALQTIIDSSYVHGSLEEIRPSVERIQWALREVLPGEELEAYEHPRASESRPVPPQIRPS